MNDTPKEQSFLVEAQTIKERAQKLNIPEDAFATTVQRYNEPTDAGVDEYSAKILIDFRI